MANGAGRKLKRRLTGGVYVDGDTADIIVAAGPQESDAGQLWCDRRVAVSELAREVAGLTGRAAEEQWASVSWTVTLGGDLAMHDVVEIPAAARALEAADRLDVCLRETQFGRVSSIEEAGYRIGHAFDGSRCVMAIASQDALADVERTFAAGGLSVSTEAAALLQLFRRAAPESAAPDAPASMALLCSHSSFAAVICDRGEPRLLYQVGLLDPLRDVLVRQPAPAAQAAIPEGELEFETDTYTIPNRDTSPRAPDVVPSRVESSVYQAAIMTVFKAAIDMYRDAYRGESLYPRKLYLTGAAVPDHTLLAFFTRHFGQHIEVQDLLAARAVRIAATSEETRSYGRDFAARQSFLGGALSAVAAASSDTALSFPLGPVADSPAAPVADRRALAPKRPALSVSFLIASATAALLAVGAVGGRLLYHSSVQADLAERLEAERARNTVLEGVRVEKAALEARMAHTRAILDGVRSMRARQVLPPQLLSIIEQSLPNGTRLDEVELSAGRVRISGSSDFRDNIPKFALALENRREDFAEVVPTTNQSVTKDADGADILVYTFSITARYVRNVASGAEQRLAGPQGEPVTATGTRAGDATPLATPPASTATPAPPPQQ